MRSETAGNQIRKLRRLSRFHRVSIYLRVSTSFFETVSSSALMLFSAGFFVVSVPRNGTARSGRVFRRGAKKKRPTSEIRRFSR